MKYNNYKFIFLEIYFIIENLKINLNTLFLQFMIKHQIKILLKHSRSLFTLKNNHLSEMKGDFILKINEDFLKFAKKQKKTLNGIMIFNENSFDDTI